MFQLLWSSSFVPLSLFGPLRKRSLGGSEGASRSIITLGDSTPLRLSISVRGGDQVRTSLIFCLSSSFLLIKLTDTLCS